MIHTLYATYTIVDFFVLDGQTHREQTTTTTRCYCFTNDQFATRSRALFLPPPLFLRPAAPTPVCTSLRAIPRLILALEHTQRRIVGIGRWDIAACTGGGSTGACSWFGWLNTNRAGCRKKGALANVPPTSPRSRKVDNVARRSRVPIVIERPPRRRWLRR